MNQTSEPRAKYIFEISWEVANKVGGIYTVLESKVLAMQKIYKDNYVLIGPYDVNKVKGYFEETAVPDIFKESFKDLESEGIKCHSGRWLVKGEPACILIDFSGIWKDINEYKGLYWEKYAIDSLNASQDYDEPFLWSIAAGKVIEALTTRNSFFSSQSESVVIHAHEWLAAGAILYLKLVSFKGGTVFTTHATTLGRVLAGAGINFYDFFDTIDADKEAYTHGVQAKHLLEKAVAGSCDVFTTVSQITSMEAQYFLKTTPKVLLPNGLDLDQFPSSEQLAISHRVHRNRMREFLLYYFFPYYTFDIKETLFYFILGRYEFHNKGIDIFIKALGELNKKLREAKSEKTIVTFFWIPSHVAGIKEEILEAREIYRDIKESFAEISDDIQAEILTYLMTGKDAKKVPLFDEDFLIEIKKKISRLKRHGLPPLASYDLVDSNDIIVLKLKEAGIENKEEDNVKAIFYPVYLGASDGLLNLSYYESIQGSHLGVFPSFYEPWGYTPLETAALGVASVTTDLAGFGRFFATTKESYIPGIFILKRFNKKDDDVIAELTDVLLNFAQLSRQDRVENKIQARRMALQADWKILIEYYVQAHNLSLEKNRA